LASNFGSPASGGMNFQTRNPLPRMTRILQIDLEIRVN